MSTNSIFNNDDNKSALFGYISPLARKKGIQYISMRIYKAFLNRERETGDKTNILRDVTSDALGDIRSIIADMIAPADDDAMYDEIWDNLTENSGEYIDKLIAENDFNNQILNFLALYRELTNTVKIDGHPSVQNKIIDEIFNSKLITSLKLSKYDNVSDINIDNDNSAYAVEQKDNADGDDVDVETKENAPVDGTIRAHGLHHGEFDDFKKHITERISRILNTCPKLNSANPDDLYINPQIGFPEYIDSTDLKSFLYSYVDRDDAESMLKSVEAIAKTFPEYSGLIILANELANNRDLLFEFYTNFGKHIVSKGQTILSNGQITYKISNPGANKLNTLRTKFTNDYINAANQVDLSTIKEMFAKITGTNKEVRIVTRIKNASSDNEAKKFVGQLYDILTYFYPSVTKTALINFVCYNVNGWSKEDAMSRLYGDLKEAINNAENIQIAIKEHQDEIKNAMIKNKKLLKENAMVSRGSTAYSYHTEEEFIDIKRLRAEDPIDARWLKSPMSFAEHMLKYEPVKTNMNSVNVHGNQSSDVLNSSLITRLKAIFEHPDKGIEGPLALLAQDYHLDTNTQFKFSNILIEQDGHLGIFRQVNGRYIPTEYASDLIQFTLFNGAANRDTEVPVLYSEMSRGDYIGTSWANFFSDRDTGVAGHNIKLGRYFLRIPSDAPKTFILKAPRYVVDIERPLFSTGNQIEYDDFISEVHKRITDNVSYLDSSRLKSLIEDSIKVEYNDDFIQHILSTGELNINLNELVPDTTEGDIIIRRIEKAYASKVRQDDGKTKTRIIVPMLKRTPDGVILYTIEGELSHWKRGGTVDTYVNNASLLSIVNLNDVSSNDIKTMLSNHFKYDFVNNGQVSYEDISVTRKKVVNKNHQIYKQMVNAFKQELLDGVAAAELMFKTQKARRLNDKGEYEDILINGKPAYVIATDPDTHEPIVKDDWKNDINGLSPIYHFRDKALVKDGKLTGRVFESDRFIIFDEKEENVVRNYGQELIDECLNYLVNRDNPSQDNMMFWTKDDNDNFDLNLTQAQEEAIANKIEEYIKHYVDLGVERLKEYKDFCRGTRINIDNVADYMLNHQLMYLNSNELLEGDTKYYKDVQIFFRRTKEHQASGNPYGNSSIRNNLTVCDSKRYTHDIGWGIKLKDRFNGVVFHTTNKYRKNVLNLLEKQLIEQGMSKEKAHEMMYGVDGEHGYVDNNINDAQSYITLQEWIRRVAARGELDKYSSLIDKLMKGENPSIDELEQFVQVQKNIYYDMYYDKVTGRVMPRQIKNAEYVLVPAFIKGTELEAVYDYMVEHNIDQINTDETSKAANGYIVDIFDDNGRLVKELNPEYRKNKRNAKRVKEYDDLMTKAIQPFSYNYLYEQQKVPQHVFTVNKFAIQIAKIVIDNIDKNHPLYPVKERYFKLMTANIRGSFVNLMKEFNIPTDENGNLLSTDASVFENIDYNKLYDKLKREFGRLGLGGDSLDYATLSDNPIIPGNTVMPNYLNMMINKVENIVQSIITRNITRQTLSGFHAAQISAIGQTELATKETIKKDGSLQYYPQLYVDVYGHEITEARYKSLSKEEQAKYKKGEVTQWIEVKLPYSALGINRNSKHYKNMTDEEIIRELDEKSLDKFIGYRIPTEGKQSTAVMKIAGFLSDGSGSTIVLPEEWVSQTGSGFGGDSVYGIMKKARIDQTGELRTIEFKRKLDRNDWYKYVSSRTECLPSEEEWLDKVNATEESVMAANSRTARDNAIVDCMLKILSDPSCLVEKLARSNFDRITGNPNAAVDKLRSKIETTRRKFRSPFNILDEAEYQEEAIQGFAIKGFSVARDVFCSVCNTVRPTINGRYAPIITYDFSRLKGNTFEAKVAELKKTFNGKGEDNVKVNAKNKTVTITHTTFGWSHNKDKNIDGDNITVYSSQTTAHILDVMKYGPVPNVNKYTFGVYKTLVDIGSRYEVAVGFIMHPAIATINKYYNRTNSIYTKDVSGKYIESALNEYCDKLAGLVKNEDGSKKINFNKHTHLVEKLNEINKAYGTNISLDYVNNNLTPIDDADIALRINDEKAYTKRHGGEERVLLYDMIHVLHFAKLMELNNNISAIRQVTNSNKFGAKQTVFETERVFKQIIDYVRSKYAWNTSTKTYMNDSVFRVNGNDMLEEIYPDLIDLVDDISDVDKALERFVKSKDNISLSAYPSLCAHLKYGNAASIVVNKAFSLTQTPQFREFVNSIENKFSDNKRLDEKTYKELRCYIISSLYRHVGFINSTLNYKLGVGFTLKEDVRETNLSEYNRIFGYDRNVDFSYPVFVTNSETGDAELKNIPVNIENMSNPTQEEIDAFAKLSPAQKVSFIHRHLTDRSREDSIFNYINERLYITFDTQHTSAGAQLISFVESSAGIDNLRDLFFKAFTNNNPLIAMTAADVIKYAFVVDGYKFTRNGVSKLIPNRILTNPIDNNGIGIVSDLNELFTNINNYLEDNILENFIRSHPNLTQINTRWVKRKGNGYDLDRRREGIITISNNQKELLDTYGITHNNMLNSYVRLKFGASTILYKIKQVLEDVVLIPLNRLERNESANWSANNEFNVYPDAINGINYDFMLTQKYM